MNLGAHMSIAGGLEKSIERAREAGATALQIFTPGAAISGQVSTFSLSPREVKTANSFPFLVAATTPMVTGTLAKMFTVSACPSWLFSPSFPAAKTTATLFSWVSLMMSRAVASL